jgi:hypothetical protein
MVNIGPIYYVSSTHMSTVVEWIGTQFENQAKSDPRRMCETKQGAKMQSLNEELNVTIRHSIHVPGGEYEF